MSATPPPGAVARRAARVILLDEHERILLFRGCDPDRPERTFWFTPGGGLDPGETPAECAAREVREETGLSDVRIGPRVWTRRAVFRILGTVYDQREDFFLASCASFAVDTAGFTDIERRSVSAHRWWTVEEIAGSDEHFAPADLAARLRELLVGGPPAEAVEVAGAVLP